MVATNLKDKIVKKIKCSLFIFFSILFILSLIGEFFYVDSLFSFFHFLIYLGLFLTLILIVITEIIERTLEKELFNRVEELKEEIKQIKGDNYDKRLTIRGIDEIDELVFFTNKVLDNFQKTLNIEKKHSLVDPLTLCFNRRALKLNFDSIKSQILRNGSNASFLLLDIDFFKKINDTYGHNIGDKVLSKLALILRKSLRTYDSLYRIGGEEFLIIFTNLDPNKSKKITKRIHLDVPKEMVELFPKINHKITFSGGFLTLDKSNIKENSVFDDVFKDIDKLLYKAKKSGRNQIIYR